MPALAMAVIQVFVILACSLTCLGIRYDDSPTTLVDGGTTPANVIDTRDIVGWTVGILGPLVTLIGVILTGIGIYLKCKK